MSNGEEYIIRFSKRSVKYAVFIIFLALFVFLAPVVPVTFSYHIPIGATCTGPCPSGNYTIYGSTSYALTRIGLTFIPQNDAHAPGWYWSPVFP